MEKSLGWVKNDRKELLHSASKQTMNRTMIINAMSIDVEDYYQVSALECVVKRAGWNKMESRVERNTMKLLDLFDETNVKGTFFTLGWVGQQNPKLVREISSRGHEVASHGMDHRRVTSLSPEAFSQDLRQSKQLLEDISGQEVVGYRAPSFSFTKANSWVYDQLADNGYTYSSSVYPVKHDHYGIPDASRFAYQAHSDVLEIPMSTLSVGKRNIPISGGGFFRLYPYFLTRFAVERFNQQDQAAYTFYLHPWEVDPDQPRVNGLPAKSRFRHYLNLDKTHGRLLRLCRDFEWSSMKAIYFGP